MENINLNTHDEYGLKAGGVLSALEKFETFFSLRLCYLLFGCAENTSKVLQAKDISVQEAVSAVKVTQSFFSVRGRMSILRNSLKALLPTHEL